MPSTALLPTSSESTTDLTYENNRYFAVMAIIAGIIS
jgi:hypothetical protein